MINIVNYFPEGIAQGTAFINRIEERHHLINRIKVNKHCILVAPRRYGKTSLVNKVAEEMKVPYCAIDLLAAYSEEYVRDQIVDKVSKLVFTLLPKISKAKQTLFKIFQKMKPELVIGAFGQKLVLQLSDKPLNDITALLLKLDETATHFNKKGVLFFDEFQQISLLKKCHAIEAAIRHAVERSKNIAYVFSGSNRHLLQQMFGDQGRPLYRLCQTITLERMKITAYHTHLQKLAKKAWGKRLPDNILTCIFNLTALHPYYMNVLCNLIWEKPTMVSAAELERLWHDYVKSQRHIISLDILDLSVNQRKLLNALARSSTKEIQASSFTAPLKISASSTQQALEVLLKQDLVYVNDTGEYAVLDPAMQYYLNNILWNE